MKFMQLFSLYISRDKKKRNKLGLSWTKLRSSCDRALLRIKFLNCIYSHEKISQYTTIFWVPAVHDW